MTYYDVVSIVSVKYTYETISRGDNDGVTYPSPPRWKNVVAFVHTHAAYDSKYKNDEFSPGDMNLAESYGVPMYVVTPLGLLLKYNPNKNSVKCLDYNMPYDKNHPEVEK